jgi:hypothetical protein
MIDDDGVDEEVARVPASAKREVALSRDTHATSLAVFVPSLINSTPLLRTIIRNTFNSKSFMYFSSMSTAGSTRVGPANLGCPAAPVAE